MKFAQILDDIVVAMVDLDKLPEYEILGVLVDVTGNKKQPDVNWKYSTKTKKFTAPALTSIKTEAIDDINGEAQIAQRNLSNLSNIYAEKLKDANNHVNDLYPNDLTKYTWIELEVEITGFSAATIADSIILEDSKRAAQLRIIEKIRRTGNTNIKNATTANVVNKERNATIKKLKVEQ